MFPIVFISCKLCNKESKQAKHVVTAICPVILKPKELNFEVDNQIKAVNRTPYFLYFFTNIRRAISSLTNNTKGSKTLAKPVGIDLFVTFKEPKANIKKPYQ